MGLSLFPRALLISAPLSVTQLAAFPSGSAVCTRRRSLAAGQLPRRPLQGADNL